MAEKKEYCGVIGIISKKKKNVIPLLYNALLALQHRGQDAAGVVIWNEGFVEKKVHGLVNNLDLSGMVGYVGIGHVRYRTFGKMNDEEIQPFVGHSCALGHNGQLINYEKLKKEIGNLKTTSDSEVILHYLERGADLLSGASLLFEKVLGAFSVVGLYKNELFAIRDPHGIRPLVYGENEDFFAFASESVALEVNNIPYSGDVGNGEVISHNGKEMKRKNFKKEQFAACMFEYVYFSRPDSKINGLSIYEVRKRLGEVLAEEHPVKDADVVIEVPDTARVAANSYARKLNLPHEEGFIKNRYVMRSFIIPQQTERERAVKIKLNPLKEVVKGKKVVLLDDSIVRGTTIKQITKMLREAGAKEIHLRITCPPIIAPCFYGIDMSTYEELIAHNKKIKEIEREIGVDSLAYLSIEGLKKAIGLELCTGCLTNQYPTEIKIKGDENGSN